MRWDKGLVIKELKILSGKLGHSPRTSDVQPALYGAAYINFGSFNKAKEAAGLKINPPKHHKLKDSAHLPSKEFAYVLGTIYGDGTCHLREDKHGSSGKISLAVRDEDFALNFKEQVEKWSGIIAKYKFNGRAFHETILHSVDACRLIEKFDINEVLNWEKGHQFEFLKGLFDSDGGITGFNLNNRKIAKRWLHLSNNNVVLVDLTTNLFNKLGIKYSVSHRIHSGFGSKKQQYEIKIYNRDGIAYFYKNIGFSIKRKQDKLKEVIGSYSNYLKETFNKPQRLLNL